MCPSSCVRTLPANSVSEFIGGAGCMHFAQALLVFDFDAADLGIFRELDGHVRFAVRQRIERVQPRPTEIVHLLAGVKILRVRFKRLTLVRFIASAELQIGRLFVAKCVDAHRRNVLRRVIRDPAALISPQAMAIFFVVSRVVVFKLYFAAAAVS